MQDTTMACIAAIEADLAQTQETFAKLDELARTLAEYAFEPSEEMLEAFERLETLCSVRHEGPIETLPAFAVRI